MIYAINLESSSLVMVIIIIFYINQFSYLTYPLLRLFNAADL
jgi:hypothetical protein